MAFGIFGQVGTPDPDSTNPPPKFRVGAQGRSPLSYKPREFRAWLGGQMDRRAMSEDAARFEQALATSGMSEPDKQRARLYRSNPQMARVMDENDARAERQKATVAAQQQRTAEHQQAIQAKAEAESQKAQEKYRTGSEIAGWARDNVRTEFLPHQFAQGMTGVVDNMASPGPGAAGPEMRYGVASPEPGAAGPTGMAPVPDQFQMPGMTQVQVKPDIPPEYRKWLIANDPQNPVLTASTNDQFNQRQNQATAAEQRQRAEAEKARAEEADHLQRTETAKGYLGADASPDEVTRFTAMSAAKGADPIKVADQIKKDRRAAIESYRKKNETEAQKNERKAGQIQKHVKDTDKELFSLKNDLLDTKMKMKSITIDPEEKAVLEEKAKLIQDRIDAIQKAPRPAAPSSKPVAAPAVDPSLLEDMKQEYQKAKETGNTKDAEWYKGVLKSHGIDVSSESVPETMGQETRYANIIGLKRGVV